MVCISMKSSLTASNPTTGMIKHAIMIGPDPITCCLKTMCSYEFFYLEIGPNIMSPPGFEVMNLDSFKSTFAHHSMT